ncbi:hypothetical protein F66182_1178 [Fusarium sp. NRRL 66182]|nr:hypothetical protein F66182_1178 [Fusarium sp. NRRL 66182]
MPGVYVPIPANSEADKGYDAHKAWLDQQWGGDSWLPQDVRKVQHKKNRAAVAKQMVRITKLAKRVGVPLHYLWDNTPPRNYLRVAVTEAPNPRLNAKIVSDVYCHMKSVYCLDNYDDTEDVSEGEIENEVGKEHGQLMPCVNGGIASSNALEDDGKGEDSVEEHDSILQSTTPPKTSHSKELRALVHSAIPFTPEKPPRAPLAQLPAPIVETRGDREKRKRKRDNDGSSTEGPAARKHVNNVTLEAQKIYQHLTSNIKLGDEVLHFLSEVILDCSPGGQGKVRLVDPLWFKVDKESEPAGLLRGLEKNTMLIIPIHHLKVQHWTLAVARLIPGESGEAGQMILNHHDSSPDDQRHSNVFNRFKEWIQRHELGYEVVIQQMNCPRQRDTINCGFHSLSCLQQELLEEGCPTSFDPTEAKESIVALLKTAYKNVHSPHQQERLQEFNKIVSAKESEYAALLFAQVNDVALSELEERRSKAENHRDQASETLKGAEESLRLLLVKQDAVKETRDRLIQEMDGEEIATTTDDLETHHLLNNGNMSQEEAIHNRTRVFNCMLRMTSRDATDNIKQVLGQQAREIAERVKEARDDVACKLSMLEKAKDQFRSIIKVCTLKKALADISLRDMGIFGNY